MPDHRHPAWVNLQPASGKRVSRQTLAEDAVDVGRRIEPNLDVLSGTRPDPILMSGYYNRARERLRTIAPTETLRIYAPEGESDALERRPDIGHRLADRLDRRTAMKDLRRSARAPVAYACRATG